MSNVAGVVAGVIVLGLGIGGIAYAATRKPSSSSSPSPTPTPNKPPKPTPTGKVTWVRASNLAPGTRVRASLSDSDFRTIADAVSRTSGFIITPDLEGLKRVLSLPAWEWALGQTITAWAPGEKLPDDWPKDDPAPQSEFHFEFTYPATVPGTNTANVTVPISSFPIAAMLWIAK